MMKTKEEIEALHRQVLSELEVFERVNAPAEAVAVQRARADALAWVLGPSGDEEKEEGEKAV